MNLAKLFERELVICAPVYFFLSFINLRVKLWITSAWFDTHLAVNHQSFLHFNGVNNEQSRVLQFYLPELFRHVFSISIEDAYILQRWLFVFLAFVCFHKYLQKWFDNGVSFAGVVLLAAVMPLTYFDHLQESAPLLLLTFLLGLWAIREHHLLATLAVFFIGGLNNETMLILPTVYFFYHFQWGTMREFLIQIRNTFGVALPLLLTVGPIRYITRHNPHGDDPLQWFINWRGIYVTFNSLGKEVPILEIYRAIYFYPLLVFGVIWVYALFSLKNVPKFLRRAAWMIPLFILAHLITGVIYEARQMLPLSYLLIPMAFFYMFRKEVKTG
tara:strand:+ start:3457 stop:4443 length:987 start_codon:yes stop_codon:yes gene_type:complete